MVQDGDKAPDFKLPADDGTTLQLSKLKGSPVVLYFYPKDDTPGCTSEAKDFSCLVDQFAAAGATVIGISPDSAESHKKFKSKYELRVPLAADTAQEASNAYGVWVEKSMYGKKYLGIERSHFVIGEDGMIIEAAVKVKPEESVERALAALG